MFQRHRSGAHLRDGGGGLGLDAGPQARAHAGLYHHPLLCSPGTGHSASAPELSARAAAQAHSCPSRSPADSLGLAQCLAWRGGFLNGRC